MSLIRKGLSIVSSVTASLEVGYVHCFLGANGSGKTSILKCVAGLCRPDAGKIEKNWKRVGYYGHQPSLYGELTVSENLEFFANLVGRQGEDGGILRRWGLSQHRDKRISELSQGLISKVSICRAFLMAADVLILDEPSAALDDVSTELLCESIKEFVGERERTVIFATHDTARLLSSADRAFVVAGGRLVAHGELPSDRESILSNYRRLNR